LPARLGLMYLQSSKSSNSKLELIMAKTEEFDLQDLLAEIRNDPSFTKFKRVVRITGTRLNLEKDREEALASHAARTSRTLHGSKRYSPKDLIDATLTDGRTRSRLVEIRVKASNHIELLEDACDAIKHHLFTEYHEQLKAFSTVDQRSALVKRVQRVALNMVAEGRTLLDLLDQIIKDIDQNGHSLRNSMELLKLLDGAKSGVVI